MKISIALATYNGSAYLKEQLNSFCCQTLLPDELVVQDDCSSDNTESIVSEFSKNAPFKVVYAKNDRNLGCSSTFNEALLKTTGDIVFLSDQDDVWLPEKIKSMVAIAEQNPHALVVMCDAELTDGSLRSTGLTKIGQIKSAGLGFDSFVMGCCCAVRRDLLNLCLPIPSEYKSHDNWIVEIAEGLESKLVYEVVLQYYRRHESNTSQFIANRTRKVTRASFYYATLRAYFDRSLIEIENSRIQQLTVMDKAVCEMRNRCSMEYGLKLENFRQAIQEDIRFRYFRKSVRQEPVVRRFFKVIGMLVDGEYKGEKRFRNFFRDMLG